MSDHQSSQPDQSSHLGIAGSMAKAFIKSPLSPIFLFASLAIGILGLLFTPRQEDPQISVPMVDIFVSYPGASSEQVGKLVAAPLERIMSEIPGVDHVYSASRRGQSMVTVQFDVGEVMGPSLVKLYDKLQSNLDMMPPGVPPPLVKPKAIDDVPVVAITLWSEQVDDTALRKLGLDLLQRIKALPDTGPGFVVGGREDQIRVEFSLARLATMGLTADSLAGSIQAANSEQRTGRVELGNSSFSVYSGKFLQTASDVERLVVGLQDGIPVYLSEVATVKQRPAETEHLVRHFTGEASDSEQPQANGAPAITLAVAKKAGTNGVDVASSIMAEVDSLKGVLIPDNVQVTVTRNYGETAKDKVNELLFKLFIATMAVAVLVFFSLGVRPAIVVLVVIPVVILVTVFGSWLLGFTIDRVSLFALIFCIGILVDDAIVVVENIYRRWLLHGKTDIATAVDAVREVGNPTIIATFTVIAALLPMGFVGDMMGPYMMPIPVLGTVAMMFSLFAAFAFTPWLTYKLRPSISALKLAEKREERTQEVVGGFYKRIIHRLATTPVLGWTTLALILLAFFGSCYLFANKAVAVKMMPYDNKSEFNVVINMPAGTALPVTADVAQQVAQAIRSNVPEVIDLQSYVGTASPYNFNGMVRHYYLRQEPWQADVQIKLLHKNDRERASHEIAVATRKFLQPIIERTGARITVAEMPPGPPVLQTLVAEIYGPTSDIRRKVATDLTEIFKQADGVGDVDNYVEQTHDSLHFEVDTDKAMRLGVTTQTINRNLAMVMGGFKAGDVKQGRALEPTYIVLQAPYAQRAQPSRLGSLPIPTADGRTVQLSELGKFTHVPEDPIVFHKDLRAVEYVVGETLGRLGAPIYGMAEIDKLLENYTTPDGITMSGRYFSPPENSFQSAFKWDGEWRVTFITFRDMGLAFFAAMILIYVLVVWEFGGFKVPLIIVSPIPLTLIGIVPGHWFIASLFGGGEFTATSMIGFIALAGIIVRNSILLVDFAQSEIRRGVPPEEALVNAGRVRMRPILLTAFALMAGSSVILFDPIFQGMAISLLFGVFVATLLTLIVIPLGCNSWRSAICPPVDDEDDGGNCEPADAVESSYIAVQPHTADNQSIAHDSNDTDSTDAASQSHSADISDSTSQSHAADTPDSASPAHAADTSDSSSPQRNAETRGKASRSQAVASADSAGASPDTESIKVTDRPRSADTTSSTSDSSAAVPVAEPHAAATSTVASSQIAEDDLTKISGIGTILAAKLRDLHITRFQQIADLTPADVDRIGDMLNPKSRIKRDRWIEQAREIVDEAALAQTEKVAHPEQQTNRKRTNKRRGIRLKDGE
jgi:multidrug efflux pump subunit AcrB/predicted flap endonuclease-1-like 5' DNA nuclease